MRRLYAVLLLVSAITGYSQNYSVTIQGQPTATVGQTQSFSAVWRDPAHGWLVLPPTGTFSWYATGGTVNSSTDVQGSVTWTSVGSGVVYYQMETWDNVYTDYYIVVVSSETPPIPNASSFEITENCSQTVVMRNGASPPSNITWYWQTSPTGTSTSLGSGASITLTTPTTLYLRARYNSSPNQWSTSSQAVGSIPIQTPPPLPAKLSDGHVISNGGGQVNLSVNAVSGVQYRWYTVASGGTPISGVTGSSYSPNITQNATYYVEALKGQCPSSGRTAVSGYVYPSPVITASNNGRIVLGSSVVLTPNYSYDTYKWRRAGVVISGATQASYETNIPGIYTVEVTKGNATAVSAAIEIKSGYAGQNENYIVTNTFLIDGITEANIDQLSVDDVSQTLQYFDGLGRPKQIVTTQGSPGKLDIVQPIVYDEFGRESKKFLPYTHGADGWFKTNFNPNSGPLFTFYQNTYGVADDDVPFSSIHFEASPMSRPLKEYGPGEAWASTANSEGRYVGYSYLTNVNGTGSEKIVAWKVGSDGQLGRASEIANYVDAGGFYQTGQLSIRETRDEQGHRVREYTDKHNRLILKKVQAVDNVVVVPEDDTHWAQTYYIYDDFGNLVMVLPPEAVKALIEQ